MKKIDLHCHTISTSSDANFNFDLAKLTEYVSTIQIDALAITNHNVFDIEQYRQIVTATKILIIPGIEIDLENGHLLVLSDPGEVVDFATRCSNVSKSILDSSVPLRLSKLREIFPDLNRYILIPHYDKKPAIADEIIESLRDVITAGEVASPKKFVYCKKDDRQLVPVFFSDVRFDTKLCTFPIRQTFIDIGDVTFSAIKYALCDRHKVFLTQHSGHSFFQANDHGLILSTGLNIVIGERSSGKSFTLNKLEKDFDRVKHISQFSLLERSDKEDSDRFNQVLRQKQCLFIQGYLKEFRSVVDDVSLIDLELDEKNLDHYREALLQHARESEKADAFSKAAFFSETEFTIDGLENLRKLIESALTLAENEEFKAIISKHISLNGLLKLAIELMERYGCSKEDGLKKTWANDLIASVKTELQRRSASTPIPEIDLYSIAMNREKIKRFKEVALSLRQEKDIFRQDIQNFKVVARTKSFHGAGELKGLSGRQLVFSRAFQVYEDPYSFLLQLRQIEGLPATDYHNFFAAIEYNILNRFGFVVSGGERSEFRLLQEISDAMQFDMLLIDEPESSFDNLFLNSEVNQLIKELSQIMPVVIVTHNSTVGASIKPDYLVYTKRIVEGEIVKYATYFGHPSDKHLKSASGDTVPNHIVLLNCLEAGSKAYIERGTTYETLKN